MLKIRLIAVGKIRESYLKEGISEYAKRISRYAELQIREVKEETGYTLTGWRFRGLVTFCTDSGLCEYMCLYTSEEFTGIPAECDEGTLE